MEIGGEVDLATGGEVDLTTGGEMVVCATSPPPKRNNNFEIFQKFCLIDCFAILGYESVNLAGEFRIGSKTYHFHLSVQFQESI